MFMDEKIQYLELASNNLVRGGIGEIGVHMIGSELIIIEGKCWKFLILLSIY